MFDVESTNIGKAPKWSAFFISCIVEIFSFPDISCKCFRNRLRRVKLAKMVQKPTIKVSFKKYWYSDGGLFKNPVWT